MKDILGQAGEVNSVSWPDNSKVSIRITDSRFEISHYPLLFMLYLHSGHEENLLRWDYGRKG